MPSEAPICGASLPTRYQRLDRQVATVVIPNLWGKSFRRMTNLWCIRATRRNPRFVGQVFRHEVQRRILAGRVVIPNLWGKSSDSGKCVSRVCQTVVIPDLWGKSSDLATSLDGRF
ncbi:hypothetical protein [Neisseria cinerea]|nr:hypothetical protein [Neisseria cinerea]